MLTIVCFSAFVIVLACSWLKWVSVKGYWAKRGVEHPTPHPALGSLTFLLKENPVEWFRKQYEVFSPTAPYFGIWLFWRPALVVCSPDLAKNVLVKDSDYFRNHLLKPGLSDKIGSLNVFTLNEPTWSSMRRRLTPVFTASKLRALQPLVRRKVHELLERIHQETRKNTHIDIRDIYTDMTTDIIGTASFGVDSGATLTGDSSIRRITRDFQQYSLYRALSWCFIFFWPELASFLRVTMFPSETVAYFRRVFHTVLQQRGGWQRQDGGDSKRQDGGDSHDLMDTLLRIRKELELEGETVSDDLLIAQAAIFVQGGFDTTATALTYISYELAFHPGVQEKLYAELVQEKKKLGVEVLDATHLADLPYLNAVIKESLRKYPAMGWLDRVASRSYKVDDHLTIEKGTPVYVSASGLHYDPRYFPDPLRFDPERFMPQNEGNIQSGTYLPFGDGPRMCIGLRFAQQTMRITISELVLNFFLKQHAGAPEPSDVKTERKGMFLAPEIKLSVEYVPRNSTVC